MLGQMLPIQTSPAPIPVQGMAALLKAKYNLHPAKLIKQQSFQAGFSFL